jgi:hypothetical protein
MTLEVMRAPSAPRIGLDLRLVLPVSLLALMLALALLAMRDGDVAQWVALAT